jgi:hypothetical protein
VEQEIHEQGDEAIVGEVLLSESIGLSERGTAGSLVPDATGIGVTLLRARLALI